MREYDDFHPLTRAEWRAWLRAHHDSSSGVWLVYFKKGSGKPRVGYEEAVEEALCFGWVDSLPRKLDDHRARILFTPRRPRSAWSRPNKERVERLIASRKMTKAGLRRIEAAKADGSWTKLDKIYDLKMPEDLRRALSENAAAREHFESFTPSVKRKLCWYVECAKREETRKKRIEDILQKVSKKRRGGT